MAHDLKWFIREVRSIMVRNLNPETDILISTPSVQLEIYLGENISEISAESLIFTSNIMVDTCNPTWTINGLVPTSRLHQALDAEVFILQFRDALNDQNIILQYPVDLRTIVRWGNIQLIYVMALPVNSIFLWTDGGFFVTQDLFRKLRGLGLIPVASRFLGIDDESEKVKSAQVLDKIRTSESNMISHRMSVESSLMKNTKLGKQVTKNNRRADLEELKRIVEFAEKEASQEEEREKLELEELSRMKDIKSELEISSNMVTEIVDLNKKSKSQMEDLMKLQFLYESRQMKLLRELQLIYPIEKLENGEFSIRGIELNLDSSQRDDELASSALGYLVHLLLLTSKYLEVPLRYQLIFYASRSMIKDAIAIGSSYGHGMLASSSASSGTTGNVFSGVTLPLYRRGTERERFELAIQWLKSDIEQLLLTRGISYSPRQNMLFNVSQLFTCELSLSIN